MWKMSFFSIKNYVYFWFYSVSSPRNPSLNIWKSLVRIRFLIHESLVRVKASCELWLIDFSVMKRSRIKNNRKFWWRKSSSFTCKKNKGKSLRNEGATSILQDTAKTGNFHTISTLYCSPWAPTSFLNSDTRVHSYIPPLLSSVLLIPTTLFAW